MIFLFSFIFLAFGLIFNQVHEDLHNSAETAFLQKDYKKANEDYLSLLEKIDRDQIDWQNYIDIVLRASETHLLLDQFDEGIALLTTLQNQKPPPAFLPRITYLLAKIYSLKEEAGKGYQVLRETSLLIPLANWRPEERAFFHTLKSALNTYYDNLLKQAKLLECTENFSEALKNYEKVFADMGKGYFLKAIDNPIVQKKVSYKIAENRFHLAYVEKKEEEELLALQATACKERDAFEEVLLNEGPSTDSVFYENSLFEMGYFYFKNNHFEKSKVFFSKLLTQKSTFSRPMLLGGIYLGKISLTENDLKNAEEMFFLAAQNIKGADSLSLEVAYLRGLVAYAAKNYQAASKFFETALAPYKERGDFFNDAFLKLAQSYINMGHQDNDPSLIKKGEDLIRKLESHEITRNKQEVSGKETAEAIKALKDYRQICQD